MDEAFEKSFDKFLHETELVVLMAEISQYFLAVNERQSIGLVRSTFKEQLDLLLGYPTNLTVFVGEDYNQRNEFRRAAFENMLAKPGVEERILAIHRELEIHELVQEQTLLNTKSREIRKKLQELTAKRV